MELIVLDNFVTLIAVHITRSRAYGHLYYGDYKYRAHTDYDTEKTL